MESACARDLIARRYRQAYDAAEVAGFSDYLYSSNGAALGYRRAHLGSLFLEAYLDQPVEQLIRAKLTRTVAREQIVEIGNLAADNALAMIGLWSTAANDLAGASEVAVATLTLPLRRSFARLGITLHDLGPADPARLGHHADRWGRYYAHDPRVCAGEIAQGQAAIATFLVRRSGRAAA